MGGKKKKKEFFLLPYGIHILNIAYCSGLLSKTNKQTNKNKQKKHLKTQKHQKTLVVDVDNIELET